MTRSPPPLRGCRSRRRRRTRTAGSATASVAKKLASVITITSRLITCVSSCAITPSSSAGESRSRMPARRAHGRRLLRAAHRERVRHRGLHHAHLRLGQVRLHAQALDDAVQLGLLGRGDLLDAHRRQRDLVRAEQLHQQQHERHRPRSSRRRRRRRTARRRTPRTRARAGTSSAASAPAARCPCRSFDRCVAMRADCRRRRCAVP